MVLAASEALRKLEEEHGAEKQVGPKSLAVLCVRELHKAGHECAAGEVDPSEVAARIMAMAAAAGSDDDDA